MTDVKKVERSCYDPQVLFCSKKPRRSHDSFFVGETHKIENQKIGKIGITIKPFFVRPISPKLSEHKVLTSAYYFSIITWPKGGIVDIAGWKVVVDHVIVSTIYRVR